jgi:mRNA interferase RelE/StbE
MYAVIVSRSVLKSLHGVPAQYLARIRATVNALAQNPRPQGCVKLEGSKDGYRIRVGVYRILYTISDNILRVEVIKIDHRSSVYK